MDPESFDTVKAQRCATAGGFSLHANVAVPANERQRLERLIRYVARPPLCLDRLDGCDDGRLVYSFKTPWRDGTDHAVFDPEDFLARLAALIPRPRAHQVRYSGVLAPAAKWRPAIVPSGAETVDSDVAGGEIIEERNSNLPESDQSRCGRKRRRNYLWPELMKRTFAVDVLICLKCGGNLRVLASIHPPENTRKVLDCLGLPSRSPPLAPARPDTSLVE